MSSAPGPEDLRAAMRAQVDFADTRLPSRAAAVRGRARTRRRRAVTGGVAVAVAATVAGALLVPRWPGQDADQTAGRTLLGQEAPATLQAGGATYDFAEGLEGEDRATLRLSPSSRPRLVTWATDAPGNRVTLTQESQSDPLALAATDFTDWALVPPGKADRVTIQAKGVVAMAAYELSSTESDTVRPPEFHGGERLLGYALARGDRARATSTTFALPDGPVRIEARCWGPGAAASLSLRNERDMSISEGPCDRTAQEAVQAGGGMTVSKGTLRTPAGRPARPGDEVRLAVRTRTDRGSVQGVVLTVYALGATRSQIAGHALPALAEYDGHQYVLRRVVNQKDAPLRGQVSSAGRGRTVVVFGGSSPDHAAARLDLRCPKQGQDCRDSAVSLTLGMGSTTQSAPFTGARSLSVTAGRDFTGTLGYAIYDQIDGAAARDR